MARIVVSDTDFGNSDFERKMIEAAGIEYVGYDTVEDRQPERLIEHLKDADGAITSYGDYTAEVFAALPNLKVVSKTGTGVDNIDVEAATKNGTMVCNVVGYGTEVVSDHAIALAMCVLRRICEMGADMRQDVWDFQRRRPLGQVKGRVFAVIGYGNIGRATALKAHGLGFEVVVWDRKGTPGQKTPEGFSYVSLDDAFAQGDVVSLHVALAPETHHLVNAERIAMMKDDAIVVNVARGAVVDADALAEALEAGKLWGAGLDVFEEEPLPADAPIRKAPNVVLTPHAAYWSEESAVELRTRCTNNAIDVVLGREPENCVNGPSRG